MKFYHTTFLFLFASLVAGCSPKLAPVSTDNLLSRPYDNYSQGTVVSSEQKMQSAPVTVEPLVTTSSSKKTKRTVENHTTTTATQPNTEIASNVQVSATSYPVSEPKPETVTAQSTFVSSSAGSGIPKVKESDITNSESVSLITRSDLVMEHAPEPEEEGALVTETIATTATSPAPLAQETVVIPQQKTLTAKEKRALQKKQQKNTSRRGLLSSTKDNKKPVAEPRSQMVNKTEPDTVVRPTMHDPDPAIKASVKSTESKAPKDTIRITRNTTAQKPVATNFRDNEKEHVKFSYYDPFGESESEFKIILSEEDFCYPYPGKFSSGYGMRGRSMHSGVDLVGKANDTVRATFSGVVRMSKYYSGYGNCVVVRHGNGLETLYGHNSKNLVKVGDRVAAGEAIGLLGRTGRATTDHCHFEVRIQGQHINPRLVIDTEKKAIQQGILVVNRGSSGKILAANSSSGIAPAKPQQPRASNTALASNNSNQQPKEQRAVTASTTYTIKSGDSLWTIAKKHGTTVSKLCNLNGISEKTKLMPGKQLVIR